MTPDIQLYDEPSIETALLGIRTCDPLAPNLPLSQHVPYTSKHTLKETVEEDAPIAESSDCTLAELHDVTSQRTSLIGEDILHLSKTFQQNCFAVLSSL